MPHLSDQYLYGKGERPARKGDWIQTFTGKQFWPLDARPEDVCIEDIAHALANLCRFGGHCREFYSVAQHSVLCARHEMQPYKAYALLHDATEAYLVDVPRPIKRHLKEYKSIEARLAEVIGKSFHLTLEPHMYQDVDERALRTEQRDLMAKPPRPWAGPDVKPWPERIVPWSPKKAERVFLATARKLGL